MIRRDVVYSGGCRDVVYFRSPPVRYPLIWGPKRGVQKWRKKRDFLTEKSRKDVFSHVSTAAFSRIFDVFWIPPL